MTKILLVLWVSIPIWAANTEPKETHVDLESSFVPVGYDTNDRVQVTVIGHFENACYKVGPYKTSVDLARKQIWVTQSAYYYEGFCTPLRVPFTQVVELAPLTAPGEYEVMDALSKRRLGVIPVKQATVSTADDYTYALVEDANLERRDGKVFLVLDGLYHDANLVLTDASITVLYFGDVVVVQPILEKRPEGAVLSTESNFRVQKELRNDLKGLHLLHIRVLNGQALNKMVRF